MIFSFSINLLVSFGHAQLKSMLHFQHTHIILSNEFLPIDLYASRCNILKFWPALIMSLPTLITTFPVNVVPNMLAANVPNNIGRNPPFLSFTSFLIA